MKADVFFISWGLAILTNPLCLTYEDAFGIDSLGGQRRLAPYV